MLRRSLMHGLHALRILVRTGAVFSDRTPTPGPAPASDPLLDQPLRAVIGVAAETQVSTALPEPLSPTSDERKKTRREQRLPALSAEKRERAAFRPAILIIVDRLPGTESPATRLLLLKRAGIEVDGRQCNEWRCPE
jgi:hypothetical protein